MVLMAKRRRRRHRKIGFNRSVARYNRHKPRLTNVLQRDKVTKRKFVALSALAASQRRSGIVSRETLHRKRGQNVRPSSRRYLESPSLSALTYFTGRFGLLHEKAGNRLRKYKSGRSGISPFGAVVLSNKRVSNERRENERVKSICAERRRRREVLFAGNKAGKGKRITTPKNYDDDSKVRC